MAKNVNETDYSLPYEVALANFRKKYGNAARFWSKDEYELMQAREEAQNKREAAREAGTAEGAWAYQKGPSDEIVEKMKGLQPGTCVVFGSAFKLPTIVKMEMPNPQPTSQNVDVSRLWY